jgi:DNA polymerase-3 subunit beta
MVSSNASTKAVSFHFEGVSIEMKSEDFDMCKKANDVCLCSYAGEPVTIGLSSQMLLESLASVKSQNVLLRLTDGTRPMLIEDAENKNRTILIMPIRIV